MKSTKQNDPKSRDPKQTERANQPSASTAATQDTQRTGQAPTRPAKKNK